MLAALGTVIVTSLSGVKNLEQLFLSRNLINDISPIGGLDRLTALGLCENSITDIAPLTNLSCLETLSLTDNNIEDVSPLAGLDRLASLYLEDNQISDISPLVKNKGLAGPGYSEYNLMLNDNPLSNDSLNIYIPELENNKVKISY